MPLSRRPNEPDTKCPDGFVCYGWRKVREGGNVLMHHERYYADELKPLVGLYVYCTIGDWLSSWLEIYLDEPWKGKPVSALSSHEELWQQLRNGEWYENL